jgi:hypothetical protein
MRAVLSAARRAGIVPGMTTEGPPVPRSPRWGLLRAVLLIVVGAVVVAFGAAVGARAADPHRALVLVVLGAAVLLLGTGWLLGMARPGAQEQSMRLSRLVLLAGGCCGVGGGIAEAIGGGVPLGLGTVVGGVGIGVLGVLVPRMREQAADDVIAAE